MANPPQEAGNSLPSKLSIALALAMVNAKPEGMAVRDYVLHLRSHLQRGRQPVADDASHRHLDSAGYWREQYGKSDVRCHELEARVIQLEREKSELMKNQAELDAAPSASKRKRVATGARPSKRPKPTPAKDSDMTETTVHEAISGDLEVLDGLGEAGRTLAQNLYVTHKLCKGGEYIDYESLCSNLVRTARSIGCLILRIPRLWRSSASLNAAFLAPSKEKVSTEVASIIRASARAFSSLLVGLRKLSSHDAQNRWSNMVVHECVKMFQSILKSIGEVAISSAAGQRASPNEADHATDKARARAAKEAKETHINSSRALVQFVNALVSYLDRNDLVHRELFEGFLFVLLDRVGKRLFFCTFGHNRCATAEEDIRMANDPGDAVDESLQESRAQALRNEMPALVTILERAIALSPYHLNSTPTSISTRQAKSQALGRSATGVSRLTPASKTPLTEKARNRLQRTLVNCMFGEEKHDEFIDCLRMPARLGGVPSVPKISDDDIGEYFRGEVWRLVGWELLAQEGEW